MLQVLEVLVVEGTGGDRVQENVPRRVRVRGTRRDQLRRVVLVECWVHWAPWGEVVQPVRKYATVGKPYRVARCKFFE